MATMTNSKINWIRAALEDGMTVYVQTAFRTWPITLRTLRQWERAGHDLLRADDKGRTLMATRTSRGRPVYDCIDGARITAQG